MKFSKKQKYITLGIVLVIIFTLIGYISSIGFNTSTPAPPAISYTDASQTLEALITNSNSNVPDDQTSAISTFENTYMVNADSVTNQTNCIDFMTWLDTQVQLNSTNLAFETNLLTALQYFATDQSDINLDNTICTDTTTVTNAIANINSALINNPATTTVAPAVTTPAPVAPTPSYLMTMAMFNQIQNGMSYEAVTNIVGFNGTLSTSSGTPGTDDYTVIYTYSGYGELGANSLLMFQNDALVTKSQDGLQ